MSPFGNMNAGSDGRFASSSFPNSVAAEALSNQRGAIQPPAGISEKQQQRWDAQVKYFNIFKVVTCLTGNMTILLYTFIRKTCLIDFFCSGIDVVVRGKCSAMECY